MGHPVRLSPSAAFGPPETVVATEASRAPSGALPLLLLVVALAAATVWFVALPALDRTSTRERSCEVVVLKTGLTKCVRDPRLHARAATHKAARAG